MESTSARAAYRVSRMTSITGSASLRMVGECERERELPLAREERERENVDDVGLLDVGGRRCPLSTGWLCFSIPGL